MTQITLLGIDLGKSTFHVIGRDEYGHEVFRRKFSRTTLIKYLSQLPICTIAFEACGGSHWLGRECQLIGHQVKLIPPQYVRPYVKGNKNDFIDAAAIAEAASRPDMRFVSVKSEQAQSVSVIHKVRQGYVKERTACMSRIGSILLEFGLSFPKGHGTMKQLFMWLGQQKQKLPQQVMHSLTDQHDYYLYLNQKVEAQDKLLQQIVAQDELGQLLKTIPGIGDMTASLCLAYIASASDFKNGRNMAAWLGLVPRQHSTGGKPTLLGISKRGNKTLRTLFIHAARAVLSRPDKTGKVYGDWLVELRRTKPFNVVTVALANKLARIAWAVMKTKQPFSAEPLTP